MYKRQERNLYVDDLIVTVQSEEMAGKLQRESIEVFSRMKMNLRKWTIGASVSYTHLTLPTKA